MSRKKARTRIISTISTLILFISLISPLSAQEKPAGEKVLIGGKTYTLYMAVSGDSPFSIARKFGITLDDLNSANPEIKDKLNSGQTVKIPVTQVETKPQTSASESKANTTEIQQPIKHIVKRKETLFSIARQYNTTQEEILKSNPTLKGSLSKGTVLIIPDASVLQTVQEKPKEELKFIEYRIVGGDNYYQLEKRFGISKDELEKLNPILKDGFNIGMIIKIPAKESNEANTNKDTNIQSNNKTKLADVPSTGKPGLSFTNQNKAFEIGVFLPFCQNHNDSSRIVQRTANFLEFYSGVLLATEKMTEAGLKLKLFVYDTYQDSKVVEKLVKRPEFLDFDLIIGPVYPENQKIVAELSAKNRIPMISPLSSDSRFVSTTPGYYQINPGKKLRLAATADYIADKYVGQNIIVLNHGTNSGDLKLILDRLNQKLGAGKFRQYNILAEGTSGLEGMLIADKENIIVLTEGNEANVSVSMTRLNTISKSNKITVIGLQEYTKTQSIDIEYMHNTRLNYLAPYFIEYGNPKVNTFIEKYRSAFSSEPTQYSFQGYDIALHFFASLGLSGKNFPATNPTPGVDLLQADYSFQKLSDFGGYMNQTFYIIEYADNYEVRSAGEIHATVVKDNVEGNEKNGLDQ